MKLGLLIRTIQINHIRKGFSLHDLNLNWKLKIHVPLFLWCLPKRGKIDGGRASENQTAEAELLKKKKDFWVTNGKQNDLIMHIYWCNLWGMMMRSCTAEPSGIKRASLLNGPLVIFLLCHWTNMEGGVVYWDYWKYTTNTEVFKQSVFVLKRSTNVLTSKYYFKVLST